MGINVEVQVECPGSDFLKINRLLFPAITGYEVGFDTEFGRFYLWYESESPGTSLDIMTEEDIDEKYLEKIAYETLSRYPSWSLTKIFRSKDRYSTFITIPAEYRYKKDLSYLVNTYEGTFVTAEFSFVPEAFSNYFDKLSKETLEDGSIPKCSFRKMKDYIDIFSAIEDPAGHYLFRDPISVLFYNLKHFYKTKQSSMVIDGKDILFRSKK